ncbi:hypothetical protein IT575_10980 [bacterium]|nr:hypothetical protein [bacterium]
MEQRQWRVPALHQALQRDGFELSRATVYRVLEGKSAPPADLVLWAMARLGQSVDEQLGIISSSTAGPGNAAISPDQLEDALYSAGLRVMRRMLAGEISTAHETAASGRIGTSAAADSETLAGGRPLSTLTASDEHSYVVSEARQKLKQRSREILDQMAGASVEESSGSSAESEPRPSAGEGGRR